MNNIDMSITDPKIAIISDIHIGVHRSSENFLQWDLAYARFLVEDMKERGVNQLFILGDVFHNRREVSLSAIETAKRFFEILVREKIRIFILAGNHDCWNDNDGEITSVSMFSSWPGVTVITTSPCQILYKENNPMRQDHELKTAKIICVPWGWTPNQINGKFDLALGHFEINSFHMTSGTMCENGITTEDINKLAPRCFSGHFHMRDHRKLKNGGFISYVGSAMPLDWGDYGTQPKAICYYNLDSKKVMFVENTVSPRYDKLDIDLILEAKDEVGLDFLKTCIANNIVKIINSGSQVKKEDIAAAIDKVKQFFPAEVQCDIRTAEISTKMDTDQNINALNTSDALMQFVDGIDSDLKDEAKAILKRVYTMVG